MRCSGHLSIFTFRSISKTVAFEAYRKKGTITGKKFLDVEKIFKVNTWEDVYYEDVAQSAFTNLINFIVRSFSMLSHAIHGNNKN